jgi:hypothetical protein
MAISEKLAPIILFTYNRPEHTRITLEYVSRCELADRSRLYVFCDGPKTDASAEARRKIYEVKRVLASRAWAGEVIVESSDSNKGLYRNVTEGVDRVIRKHGRCIVLEDDLKIGINFLRFMNIALEKYEHEHVIKQISGFQYPVDIPKRHGALLMPLCNTWGWGTWERAWNEVDLSAPGHEALRADKNLRHLFNLNGAYDYATMLERQMASSRFGSWGVIYWWSIFRKNGLVVYPDYSLIQHNDFDHSGVHASDDSHFNLQDWNEDYGIETFPEAISGVDALEFAAVRKHIQRRNALSVRNVLIRVKSLLGRLR